MLVCPKCRMINADDAETCAGCGSNLENATQQRKGSGITMFGGPPRKSEIKPLSEQRQESNIAAEYRSKGAIAPNGSGSEGTNAKGVAFSTGGSKPKKPWE